MRPRKSVDEQLAEEEKSDIDKAEKAVDDVIPAPKPEPKSEVETRVVDRISIAEEMQKQGWNVIAIKEIGYEKHYTLVKEK